MVEVVNIMRSVSKCAAGALLLALALTSTLTTAQKPAPEKFQRAIDRSQDAARILALLADPNSGFPKGLIDKARIVAIFPRADRQDALVRRFLQGYGVMSARGQDGWSLPAFYQFLSAPRKFTGGSQENFGLILLFMNDDALSWLEKDRSEFKKERAATPGPVNSDTATKSQESANKQILAYTYYNGKLNGKIDPDFFNDFFLDQDNNINGPVYGAKGREVLAGKKIDPASLPAGLAAFQEALRKQQPTQ